MKRVWRGTAWIVMFMIIVTTFSSNISIATNDDLVISEEINEKTIEEELNRQLEELLNDASEKADEIVEGLDFSEGDPYIDVLELDEEEYRQWKLDLTDNGEYNRGFTQSIVENNIISNEYIGVSIHENGLFNMGTTGGNPNVETDNDKDLLYRYPNGETSFTTVRIDGEDYQFSSDGPPIFNEDGTQAVAIMTREDLIIKQIISFMMNPNTGREDMAEIRYEAVNRGDTTYNLGIRIMLDTMLGDNDGAPFKVPGIGDVTHEIEIVGNRIPQYWQAFDDLDNPSVVASGAFYRNFSERPDKIQFAAWPGIVDVPWDYEIDSNRIVTRDSAVGIYFNPRELRPNETMSVETYYGIGDFSSTGGSDEISLRVTAPQELEVNQQTGNYYSNPFTITAYIKNNSADIARNVRIALNLPIGQGLTLSSPSNNINNIGNLAPREEKSISYSVLASSQIIDKIANYNMELESDNIEGKSLNFTIKLPRATISSGGSITLNKTSLDLQKDETFRLQATLNNIVGNVTWFSDNPTVAKVNSSGLVTAYSAGTANINASVAGKSARCTVRVTGPTSGIIGVEFQHPTLSIGINQTRYLNLIFSPFNAPNKRVRSWTSSNPTIVSVSPSGSIKGLKKGTATITAITEVGVTAVCTITVVELEPILELGDGFNVSDEGVGPEINFAGKKFPLFKLTMGVEMKLGKPGKEKIKLVYNEKDDKFVAYFGNLADPTGSDDTKPDGTLTEGAKQLRIDTYQRVKAMMGLVGKKTNREFYNSYRSLIQKSSPFTVNGDKSSFGYIEFIKTDNGYRLATGHYCILFEGAANTTYNFPPAPVVFVKFTLGGSIQTGLRVKLNEVGNLLKGVTACGEVELKFKPKIGVGGDLVVAKVEAGIEGEVKAKLLLQPLLNPRFSLERDLKATISSKLYLKYKAFVFINNKHWIDLPSLQFYPRGTGRMANLAAMDIDYDNLVLMPRDYTLRPSQFMGNSSRRSTFSINDSNINHNILKSNVYPDGEPQLGLLQDGKRILVWIDDDTSRDNESNYTALYYSIFDGSTWSEPEQIDNDGTADFGPSVVSQRGQVYVAWQNAEIKFGNDVTPETMAKNMGIKVAKWEDDEFKVYDITKPDDTLDNAPIITSDGDNAAVVWTKNTANDVFGIEGETILLRSVLDEEKFTEPKELLKSQNMIGGVTTAFNQGENIIVYSQDIDGDIMTFDDRELMMIVGNNQPINITNNDIGDINPKLVMNGRNAELYWYSEDEINCIPDLNLRNIYRIKREKPIGANFNVVINNSQRAIIWEDSTGFRSDLFGIFYDSEIGQWGDPIQITDLDTRIRNTSSVLAEDGTLYMSYISAPVLEYLEEDLSPFGDANLMFTELNPGYDLMIADDVAYDSRLVYGGSELDLGLYVENQGQRTIDGLVAKIYDGDRLISEEEIDIILGSGKGSFIDISYKLPDEMIVHEISISILPEKGIDYDLSNNETRVKMGEAEISIEKPIVTGMGSSRTITVQIKNLGYTNSDEVIVELMTGEDENDNIIDSARISSIPGQSSRVVEFDIPINRNTFTSIDEDSILVYVHAKDRDSYLLDSNFAQIENVYKVDPITLSSGAMAGNTIILNIDNNLPDLVRGLLCVESINEEGYQIIYGQEKDMEPLYGESMQLDLSGIDMDYDTLRVYVLNFEDRAISNVIDINEPNILKVVKPTATPRPGLYNKSQRVSFTNATEGADIYYTIDGSEPTINSILYTGPILVSRNMTIKVKAIKEGMLDSEIQVLNYIIQEDSPVIPPIEPPVDPPIPYPESSEDSRESRRDRVQVKVKTFLEQFNGLSDEQILKIMDSIPYTIKSINLNIEQLKKITQGYFTDKQLQEIVENPEILVGLLKETNISYQIINLISKEKVIFKDMKEDHWAMSYVNKALGLGFVEGFEDNTFRPNNPLIVADTFAFLDRVLIANNIIGSKLSRSIVEKYITNKGHWSYYSTASISSRLSESTLKKVYELKAGVVPRELVAQVLYEITEGKLPEVKELQIFYDISQSEYKEALDYCIKTGLLNGTSSTTMEPKKTVTRAEMIVIISRLDDLLKK